MFVLLTIFTWKVAPQESQPSQGTAIEVPLLVAIFAGSNRGQVLAAARLTDTLELIAVEGEPIIQRLRNDLLEETRDALETTVQVAGGWLTAADFRALGMELTYNQEELTATVAVPVTLLQTHTLSILRPRTVPAYPPARNASLAVSLPLWGQARRSTTEDSEGEEDSLSLALRAAPALHLMGWVLESDIRVSNTEQFVRDNTRIVRLFEQSNTRLQIGEVLQLSRGLQVSRPLLGISVDNQLADNRRVTAGPLLPYPLIFEEGGTVDVFLNGQLVRSVPVGPGQYQLGDLPLTPGVNTVGVEFTGNSGATDTRELVIPHTGTLLNRRAASYAVSLGVDSSDDVEPSIETMHGSGFIRYGLFEFLSAGALVDATGGGNGKTGLELVAATPLGEVQGSAYASHDTQRGLGWAGQAGYRLSFPTQPALPVVSSSVEYRSADFVQTSPGGAGGERPAWLIATTLSQALPLQFGLLVGHTHRISHDGGTGSSLLYGAVSRSIRRQAAVRVNGSVDFQDPSERWEVSVTVSARTAGRFFGGSTSADLRRNTVDLAVNAVRPGETQLSGTARVRTIGVETGTVAGASISGRAAAPRFDLSGGGSVNLQDGDGLVNQDVQSTVLFGQVGSGLYYADGALAVGPPVRASWAMVRRDARLPTDLLEVRSPGRSIPRRSGILGPAFVGPLTPGNQEALLISVPGLPADYSLGPTEFTVTPGYRSGTVITVVSLQRLYVRGRLVDSRGNPVVFVGLQVEEVDDGNQEPRDSQEIPAAFTDEHGIFEVYGVVPREYSLRLRDGTNRTAILTVPREEGPLVVVDDVMAREPVQPEPAQDERRQPGGSQTGGAE